MTDPRRVIRDELVQSLLHRLEKDLSDVRNLSDSRIRFIPRQALIDIISQQKVVRLLSALSTHSSEKNAPVQGLARYVSPEAGGCHCQKAECTGARMILATLLFIGKEDLIATILPSIEPKVCDQDLPFATKLVPRRQTNRLDHDESIRGPPSSQAQTPVTHAEFSPALSHHLNAYERALFSFFQWQVLSPYLTHLGQTENSHEVPDEMCLPWQDLEKVEKPAEGTFSFVQKVRIFPGSHNLTQNTSNVFALKTFEQTITAGLTQQRFDNELRANRNAPQHTRIVPVLAAFQHRRNCHLVFPWADGGSLLSIWESFSPMHIESSGKPQPATWCSESWLLDECIGIAEALAATHALTEDVKPGCIRQLHADIKPENILGFFSDDSEGRSLTLKLADFGEAIQIDDNVEITDDMVPHTKTYRPPEHNPLGIIGLNYDIWCLGCVYLDFITWFLDGWKGVEAFRDARENEGDDPLIAEADGPEMVEDTFFKRSRKAQIPRIRMGSRIKTSMNSGQHTKRSSLWITSSVGIQHKVKENVWIHIESIKRHKKCSVYLKYFTEYIAKNMLIVNTRDRADSNEVVRELKSLKNAMQK